MISISMAVNWWMRGVTWRDWLNMATSPSRLMRFSPRSSLSSCNWLPDWLPIQAAVGTSWMWFPRRSSQRKPSKWVLQEKQQITSDYCWCWSCCSSCCWSVFDRNIQFIPITRVIRLINLGMWSYYRGMWSYGWSCWLVLIVIYRWPQ